MNLRHLLLCLLICLWAARAQDPLPEPEPHPEPAEFEAPVPPEVLDAETAEPPAETHPPVLPDAPGAVPSTSAPGAPADTAAAPPPAPRPVPAVPPEPTDDLRLNFQGVPLDTVLDYLSHAAGFIIVRQAPVPGTVDIVSHQTVSADEAVRLLHAVLNERGYALLRDGRVLTVVSREDARTRDLPVQSGNDPAALAKSGEMVTQIVPIRHTNAAKLIETLKPLLPPQATITANDDSNALVITDTQVNIRRMMEIVQALDTAVSSILDIKVIALSYADAAETAEVINKIYETPTSRAANQNDPNARRAQFFSRMRGMMGGGGGGDESADGSKDIKQTANFVRAVADQRGNAVVVTAPGEVIPQIQQLVKELDIATEALTTVRVFPLRFADATELANVIAGLYPDTTSSANRNQQARSGRGFFGPGAQMVQQSNGTTASERKQTEAKVLAVADTRTNSVIVSASSATMENVAAVVQSLDATPANVPTVYIYRLQNADVTKTKAILDNMYEDVGTAGSGSSRSTTRTTRTTNTTGTTGTTRAPSGTGTTSRNTGGTSR